MPTTYSFVSYKGGGGRTSTLLNVANALALQGLNVLVVDFDFAACGFPTFSSTRTPDSMFQPDQLRCLGAKTTLAAPDAARVELPGLLSVLGDALPATMRELGVRLRDTCVYEYCSVNSHPLDGRLFMVPLGGYFLRQASSDRPDSKGIATDFVYYPPADNRELAVLHELQVTDRVFETRDDINFFQCAINNAVQRIRSEGGCDIDYVLIDERPATAFSRLAGCVVSDGVVVVTSCSRGTMAAIKQWIDAFSHTTPVGDKRRRSLPVVGVVMSPLLDAVRAGHGANNEPLLALDQHEDQVKLGTYLRARQDRGDGAVLLPRQADLPRFLELLSDSFAETSAESPARPREHAAEPGLLWSASYRENARLIDLFDTVLPFFCCQPYQIHDQLLDLRAFARGVDTGESTDAFTTRSLLTLVGHLRSVKLERRDPDHVYDLWDKWKQGADTRDFPALLKHDAWRTHWFHAIAQQAAERWEETLTSLQLTAKTQSDFAKSSWLADVWQEDWRVFRRLAHACVRLAEERPAQKAEHVSAAKRYFDRAKDIIAKTPQRPDLCRADAEIRVEEADFLASQQEYTNAWTLLNNIIRDASTMPPALVRRVIDFVAHNLQHFDRGTRDEAFRLISDRLKDLLQRHDRYVQFVPALARLYVRRYWLDSSERKDDEEKEARNFTIKLLEDWRALQPTGSTSSLGRVAAFLGEMYLQTASWQEDTMQYSTIKQANEILEIAVQHDPSAPESHLLLALSRYLHFTHRRGRFASGAGPEAGTQQARMHRERAVRQRDAFYAFEQATALVRHRDRRSGKSGIDFYFDARAAPEVARLLPTAIRHLAYRTDDVLGRRIDCWLQRFGLTAQGELEGTLAKKVF